MDTDCANFTDFVDDLFSYSKNKKATRRVAFF